MRTRHHVLAAALACLTPSFADAQLVACTITGPAAIRGYAADACQKSADMFSFMIPQFAQALTGGGAIPGTANTLGGLGKFSFNVRVTAVDGRVPDVDAITLSASGAQASRLATKKSPVPAPVVDVGVGILPGFRVGRTKLFSLDGVVNVVYLPDVSVDKLNVVVPKDRVKLGYGGRLGITRDGRMVPAISASFIRRELPSSNITADFQGGTGATNQLSLTGFTVRSDAIRVSISKRFGFLELGGGAGRDTYQTQLNIGATVNQGGNTGTAAYAIKQEVKRDVAYVSAAFNLPFLKLSAEVGQASGGTTLSTYNAFVDGGQTDARRFGTAGIRFSF